MKPLNLAEKNVFCLNCVSCNVLVFNGIPYKYVWAERLENKLTFLILLEIKLKRSVKYWRT